MPGELPDDDRPAYDQARLGGVCVRAEPLGADHDRDGALLEGAGRAGCEVLAGALCSRCWLLRSDCWVVVLELSELLR